jgi:hypothetical protein
LLFVGHITSVSYRCDLGHNMGRHLYIKTLMLSAVNYLAGLVISAYGSPLAGAADGAAVTDETVRGVVTCP